jgi:hypothetical protein
MELRDTLAAIGIVATVVRVVALARTDRRSPAFAQAATNTAAVVFVASATLVIALAFAYLWPVRRLTVLTIIVAYLAAGVWALRLIGRLLARRVTGDS